LDIGSDNAVPIRKLLHHKRAGRQTEGWTETLQTLSGSIWPYSKHQLYGSLYGSSMSLLALDSS